MFQKNMLIDGFSLRGYDGEPPSGRKYKKGQAYA